MSSDSGNKRRGWDRLFHGIDRIVQGVDNARKLMQQQRELEPYTAPYDLVLSKGILKLRHYTRAPDDGVAMLGEPLLFVPPLMVTAEIYDISPELSAVTWLQSQGIDVWLADFGKPEQEDGWDRTLDDHVVAIDRAIEAVAKATGSPVHVAGYSQGGMFAYQAAAYRKSADVASLITFGSPVDLRRNMPVNIHEALAERLLSAAQSVIKAPINELKGLPGILNSYGFKLVSPRQEIKHLLKVVGMMHDEEALKRVLPTRRFLGGEGFIAWPGPALRKFVDEYVVNNRLLSGGFVIAGKSASLTDLTVPILCFIGEKDEIAKPAAIRAIHKAVTHDQVYEHPLEAGHFGLVVGSKALSEVWPQVAAWIAWRAGVGPRPVFPGEPLQETEASDHTIGPQASSDDLPGGRHMGKAVSSWKPLKDLATDLAGGLWQQLGEVSLGLTDTLHTMRWKLPRMAQLLGLEDDARLSMGQILAKQAEAIPEVPFFFWRGRVHTYAEVDQWVDQIAASLLAHGMTLHQRVGVAMQHHPGYLLTVAALSRIGAVPVLLPPHLPDTESAALFVTCGVSSIIADPHTLPRLQHLPSTIQRFLFALQPTEGPPPKGVVLLGTSQEAMHWPQDISPNPGRSVDLAMILLTAGTTGPPKAVQISNRRWGIHALATAVLCTLTPQDTVYANVPLHQSLGILHNVGGALVSGARLAMPSHTQSGDHEADADPLSPDIFWRDVRGLGVTVAFYTEQQAQHLLAIPPQLSDTKESRHSLRLLVGHGMNEATWRGLQTRYKGLQIAEFYSTTESNVMLANAQGSPPGAVGRPMFGDDQDLAIAAYDPETHSLRREASGLCIKNPPGQPGIFLSRVDRIQQPLQFASYVDPLLTDHHIIRDVFAQGDAWFISHDLMQQGADGHFYFVRALSSPLNEPSPV